MLSGLLITPDGKSWHGNSGNYRVNSTNIRAAIIEDCILEKISQDLQGDEFVHQLTEHAKRAQMPSDGGELEALQRQIREVDKAINRLMALIEQTDTPEPILRRIETREAERQNLADSLEHLKTESMRAKAMAEVKESDVRKMLKALAEDILLLDREYLKDFLKGVVENITLDQKTRTGRINYKIQASGVKVASPRGFEPRLPP